MRSESYFQGAINDAVAARRDASWKEQYPKYFWAISLEANVDWTRDTGFHLSVSSTKSILVAHVVSLRASLGLDFDPCVVNADVSVLLFIDDRDRHGIFFNKLDRFFILLKSRKASIFKVINSIYFLLEWHYLLTFHLCSPLLSKLPVWIPIIRLYCTYNLLKPADCRVLISALARC